METSGQRRRVRAASRISAPQRCVAPLARRRTRSSRPCSCVAGTAYFAAQHCLVASRVTVCPKLVSGALRNVVATRRRPLQRSGPTSRAGACCGGGRMLSDAPRAHGGACRAAALAGQQRRRAAEAHRVGGCRTPALRPQLCGIAHWRGAETAQPHHAQPFSSPFLAHSTSSCAVPAPPPDARRTWITTWTPPGTIRGP